MDKNVSMLPQKYPEERVVDVPLKRCAQQGCRKLASMGVEGSKMVVYFREHAEDEMVDICGKRCAQEGRSKRPNFGVEGSMRAMY